MITEDKTEGRKQGRGHESSDRRARLGDALRANLRRRKMQLRLQAEMPDEVGDSCDFKS